jgi:hypothetical protein
MAAGALDIPFTGKFLFIAGRSRRGRLFDISAGLPRVFGLRRLILAAARRTAGRIECLGERALHHSDPLGLTTTMGPQLKLELIRWLSLAHRKSRGINLRRRADRRETFGFL